MNNLNEHFIGVVPARGGSKRLQNKNLRIIKNDSMTEIAIKEGLKSKFVKKLILSSDSDNILGLGKKFPIILDKREPFLSDDKSTTLSLLKNLVYKYSINPDKTSFVLLQPTSPLRTFKDINKAIEIFNLNNADSVVTATQIPDFLSNKKMMELDAENKIKKFGFKPLIGKKILIRNGPAVLVTKVKNILDNTLYGKNSYVSEMPYQRSIDIDEEDDFLIAKIMYDKYLNHDS